MTQTQLATTIAQAVAAALAAKGGKPSKKKANAPKEPVDRKAAYEAAILSGMKRKLGKDADIQLRVNVLPYKVWLEKGRQVRKGEKGVRGLFHVSQTDVLVAKEATTEATTESTSTVQ